jgi:hypothetical protein
VHPKPSLLQSSLISKKFRPSLFGLTLRKSLARRRQETCGHRHSAEFEARATQPNHDVNPLSSLCRCCCLSSGPSRRLPHQPTSDRDMNLHSSHSTSSIRGISGVVHQTVEELMGMHLNDEQIVSIAMRPNTLQSPASTFRRGFQSGLLQVTI